MKTWLPLCLYFLICIAWTQPDEQAVRQFQQLPWQYGPKEVNIGGYSTMKIPEECGFLDMFAAKQFLTITQNIPSESTQAVIMHSEGWFMVFEYEATGYIKDDEKDNLDEKAILDSVREGTEEGNRIRRQKGWPEMKVVGWQVKPNYNQTTNNLEWCILGESEGERVVNHNTRYLSRHGVMTVNMVTGPAEFTKHLAQFRQIMSSYDFVQGQRYADFKEGDPIAQYGLTALIAGGAAAYAAKAGLFQKFWKFGIVLVAGAWAAVRRLFRRSAE